MVIPLLAGLALRGLPLLARARPFILPALRKITKPFIGVIRTPLALIGGSFLLKSPTARKAIITAPSSLTELGGTLGTQFETSLEKEPKESKLRKIAGLGLIGVGIAGAGLGLREVIRRRTRIAGETARERRARRREELREARLAATPVAATPLLPVSEEIPTGAVPTAVEPLTPSGPSPLAVETTGAVKPTVSRKPRKKKELSFLNAPVFVNQIQVTG